VDGAAVVETMCHVIPVAGDHGVFYFRKMIENFEIKAATGANLVLIQNVQHAPESHPVTVIHARIHGNVRLGRPALWQVLEKLHVRRDPERDASIAGPFDDRPLRDGCIVEPAWCETHVGFSVRMRCVIGGLPERTGSFGRTILLETTKSQSVSSVPVTRETF